VGPVHCIRHRQSKVSVLQSSSLECACAQMVAKAAAWPRTSGVHGQGRGPSGTNECAVKQRWQRLRKDCSIEECTTDVRCIFFSFDVDPAILKDLYSWQMAVWVVVVLDQGCEARRMSSPEDGTCSFYGFRTCWRTIECICLLIVININYYY